MACLVARALKNLSESDSRGGKRGPWPASWSSPPPRSNHLWRPLTLTGPYYIRPLDALPTNWCHLAASFYLNSLLKLRSIFNTVEMNWPLLKNYFFRPKKTSENKTWMVSYPMKFLRPLLRFPVGRKFAILPLSKNSWRSHNKEANEKTLDFMRPKLYFIWILVKTKIIAKGERGVG